VAEVSAAPKVSATQVERFTQCPRSWFYRYVLGIQEPTTPALELGNRIHAALEARGKGEAEPILRKRELAMVDAAWTEMRKGPQGKGGPRWGSWLSPGDLVVYEQGYEVPTYEGGPTWVGFWDVLWVPARPGPVVAAVPDYKTRGDAFWAPSPKAMLETVQMRAYQAAVLQASGDDVWRSESAVVGCAHVNVLTQGEPRAWTVAGEVEAPEVRDAWARLLDTVRQMVATRPLAEAEVEQRGATNGYCRAFRKTCPHFERCRPPAELGITKKPVSKEEALGFKEQMEEIRRAQQRAAAESKGPGAPAVAEPNVTLTGEGAKQFVADREGLKPTQDVAVQTSAQAATPYQGRTQALAPPDAPPREQSPASLSVPPGTKPEDLPEEVRHLAASKPSPEAEHQSGSKPAPVLDPPRRGARRPAKSEQAADVPSGPTVYVDCIPEKGAYAGALVLADEWLAEPKQACVEGAGVADFRLVDYGKGRGLLVDAIRSKALEGLPAAFLVHSMSPGAMEFLEVVVPLASTVVRGGLR
jgi:CRISPR/Cas system-associated exonuclease Cas4 (RecB family)